MHQHALSHFWLYMHPLHACQYWLCKLISVVSMVKTLIVHQPHLIDQLRIQLLLGLDNNWMLPSALNSLYETGSRQQTIEALLRGMIPQIVL